MNLNTKDNLLFEGAYFKGIVELPGNEKCPTSLVSLMEYVPNQPHHYLCTLILKDYVPCLIKNEAVFFNVVEENNRVYAHNLIKNTSAPTGQVEMSRYDFYQKGAFNLELLNGNYHPHSHGGNNDFVLSFHNNKHRLSFNADLGPTPDGAISEFVEI